MSDPRLTPDPELATMNAAARITVPLANLLRRADGSRDRQLIYGDAVTVLHKTDAWCYVQAVKDGYCGFVAFNSIGAPYTPTHSVIAPATHAYAAPNFKSPDQTSLTFGSQINVLKSTGRFAETALGYIPVEHIAPVTQRADDPAKVAALFLGTPYLWGGNSRWGIDCSGLVQAALQACGIPCLGDSDQQQSLGHPASGPYQRNDLIFWKGHVALVVAEDRLIHANAGSMSTKYEGIQAAITRIQTSGDGPTTAHRRL